VSIEGITLLGDYANGWVLMVVGTWLFTSLMRTFFGGRE